MYTASLDQSDVLQHYGYMQAGWFLLAIYCACLSPSMAQAQEHRSRTLEEIVVTAQRREEQTIDIPMSISAISGEQLLKAGITNALDLSFAVPSMSVSEPGPGMQLITLRGISSIRGTAPLVGAYLDEMPLSAFQSEYTSGPDLRVIDMERVEVLKGPQGTLFGEGAAGGVIRFITRDPDLERFGGDIGTELSNTTDGDWSQEVTAVLNAPVVKDVFGIRVAAQYENRAGWIDQQATEARSVVDLITGQPIILPGNAARTDINDSEVKHVRVKALFSPTENLQIKGMAEIHRNDGGGNNTVNRLPYGDRKFIQGVDGSTRTEYFDDYDLFNVTASYDFGFAELLSSTSYAETEGNQRFSQVTSEPVPFLEIGYGFVRENSLTSQEFRLASTTQGPFKWTVGANYKDVEVKSTDTDGFELILFGGTPGQLVLMDLDGNRNVGQTESWAGFADASYTFADRFEVGGGLRYFEDTRTTHGFDRTGVRFGDRSADFNKTTYRGYIKYAVSEAANVYASVGTGFRSGNAIPPGLVARGAPPSYDPDETIFYELGTKLAALDGRVRLDAAVFYGEYQNMQEDIGRVIGNDLVQYTANGQDAEVRGFELNIDWAAGDQLTLGLSGDVTDTEITFIDPSYDVSTLSYSVGDPINYVPKYSLSARADYRFQWADGMPGFFRLNFNRKGESRETQRHRYGGIVLTDRYVAPEVNFLNASVGGERYGWECSLFGENLLDEDRVILPGVTGITVQARPRTIGVAIRKSF